MTEGGKDANVYGSTQSEDSKLMATAVAGAAFSAVKGEAGKIKDMALSLRNGPPSMSALSYIAGVSLLVVGFISFLGKFFTLHVIDAVIQLYMCLFGLVIIVIEARGTILPRFILEDIRTYFAFTTVVWGRGCFLIFVGTLSLAEWSFMHILLGIYLIGLGAGMLYWGLGAARTLEGLVDEMKDPAVVRETFNKFDHNDNGLLETAELGKLLESLGANLKPPELEAAILFMDKNHDGSISLAEFQAWWSKTDIIDIV